MVTKLLLISCEQSKLEEIENIILSKAPDTLVNVAYGETNALEIFEEWKKSKESENDPINKCLAFIEENLDTPLHEVADKFYFNPSYLSSLIKKKRGMTFCQYVHYLRLNKARLLLKSTRLRVQEVAKRVGYHDSRYFSRVFRKENGVSPIQYRRLHFRNSSSACNFTPAGFRDQYRR